MFSSNLCSEWSRFMRIVEIRIISSCLSKSIILMVCNGYDCVVERCVDMCYVISNLFVYMFMCVSWLFSYCILFFLIIF